MYLDWICCHCYFLVLGGGHVVSHFLGKWLSILTYLQPTYNINIPSIISYIVIKKLKYAVIYYFKECCFC